MKRLLRILFDTSTVMSLLLCLAMVALWVRSHWVTRFVGWSDQKQFVGALSMGGLIRFEHGTYVAGKPGWHTDAYPTPAGGLWREVEARDRSGGLLRRIGIAYACIDYKFDGKEMRRALYLPHWLFVGVLAVAPAVWMGRRVRRHRPGTCVACGYDLRATPERCPECGRVVSPRGG